MHAIDASRAVHVGKNKRVETGSKSLQWASFQLRAWQGASLVLAWCCMRSRGAIAVMHAIEWFGPTACMASQALRTSESTKLLNSPHENTHTRTEVQAMHACRFEVTRGDPTPQDRDREHTNRVPREHRGCHAWHAV
jgi:hypothetical protein